ncbi:MAG: nucleotidyltransferase [Actinomycetia bacterium]|nr:nucleotidyltransferase [Actinomycetes bacterium]
MHQTVKEAFAKFRTWLKLDPVELAKAIATHNFVTERLRAKGVITAAFLQGSLRRKTMIPPLRDVDKVVILAVDFRQLTNGAQEAAERVSAALSEIYPNLTPIIGKHCVTLDFGETTFSFDIVPAIDLGDDIEIVDTKSGGWKRSNTRLWIRLVEARNQICDGGFIHQVRMAKFFVRFTLDGILPGPHTESFAYAVIGRPLDDDEALAAVLRFGASSLAPGEEYWDPTGVEELGHKLELDVRDRAHKGFSSAATRAEEAVRLRRAGQHNAAIAIWHDIFGEGFPKPDETEALRGLSRGLGISPLGIVAPRPTNAPPLVRPWRP